MNKASLLNIIDKAVFIFTVIFLLTLTNSIFLNQLGYYGALLLLLLRFAVSGKNPFRKSGLEAAFLLIILAELLSSLLSENQGRAFFYMLKRVLIFPVTYTIIASASDTSRGRKYFYLYIGASLASVLVYLFFSYRHYLLNLYSMQQSGPSIFQYPITASEIMSFTVIILFAFLVNEKTSLKYKLLIFAGFALSALALFSTYKRTGWIGTAAGIIVILVINKQWKTLAAGLAVAVLVFLLQENISRAGYYYLKENKVAAGKEFDTEGRAYNVLPLDEKYIISDFDKGIAVYRDTVRQSVFETPSPVTALKHWKDNFYAAYLLDSRFLLLKESSGSFSMAGEFITPGFPVASASANNYFYVLDADSGLSVFKDPYNLNDRIVLKQFSGSSRFFIDEKYAAAFAGSTLKIFSVSSGLPGDLIFSADPPEGFTMVFYEKGEGLLTGKEGTILFQTGGGGIVFSNIYGELKNLFIAETSNDRLFVMDTPGNFYQLDYPLNGRIEILLKDLITPVPSSLAISDNLIYFTYVKESRLLSIYDIYNPSNFNRFAMWRAGWEMFKDHPFFGVGDVDLQEYYIRYKRPYDKEIMGHLHNNFVHILATLGLFGLFAICFLIIKILIINYRIFRSFKGSGFYASYALGVVGSFCSVIAAGLTEVNIWDHEILTLILFTTGLNAAFYYHLTKDKI